jgi:thioredoxin reductase
LYDLDFVERYFQIQIPFDWMSAKASETLLRIQPKTSIITNRRVEDVDGTDWKNNAVSELQAPATVADQSGVDVIINAAVLRIDTGFMQVGAKDARGCLKVNEHYQLEGAEGNNVFVIGDACAKDVKMGYLAGLQVRIRTVEMLKAI